MYDSVTKVTDAREAKEQKHRDRLRAKGKAFQAEAEAAATGSTILMQGLLLKRCASLRRCRRVHGGVG